MKITEVQCIQTYKMKQSDDKLLHVWAGHLLLSFSVSLQIDVPMKEVADVDPSC